jgi:hypothetical protein
MGSNHELVLEMGKAQRPKYSRTYTIQIGTEQESSWLFWVSPTSILPSSPAGMLSFLVMISEQWQKVLALGVFWGLADPGGCPCPDVAPSLGSVSSSHFLSTLYKNVQQSTLDRHSAALGSSFLAVLASRLGTLFWEQNASDHLSCSHPTIRWPWFLFLFISA